MRWGLEMIRMKMTDQQREDYVRRATKKTERLVARPMPEKIQRAWQRTAYWRAEAMRMREKLRNLGHGQ